MFAAVALVAYLVQPGDTLSGIAASHGASLAAVEAANPKLANPDLIYAGQTIEIPRGSSAAQGYTATSGGGQSAPAHHSASSYNSPSSTSSATTRTSSSGSTGYSASSSGTSSRSSSGSLSDVPGVPQSFAACVALRESTNLQDPAANGNAYGIIPASGYNVNGTSLSNQKQVFAQLYQKYGTRPWASNGC